MEEDSQRRDRQELLKRLDGAQTPPEVASARTAADNWLVEHPDDGDVRQARERLEAAELEEDLDLEEGGPT